MNVFPHIRVLLVEDSPSDHVLIEGLLDRLPGEPFEFSHVHTLADALERLKQGDIDVVLLDLGLPDSFGLETCVRAVQHSPTVPVVVLTGQDDETLAVQAIEQGAQDYLSKSNLNGPLIARALKYAVERNRAATELQRQHQTLDLIANEVPAILWTTDSRLRITSSLGAGLAVLGLRPNQVVGMTLFQYFETDDEANEVIAAHRRALAGEAVIFETRWQGRAFESHVVPLRQHDRVVGTIGVALDVTERRHVNAELHLAREIQRSLLPRSTPNLPGFEIAGAVFPAETTAADWFDYVTLTDGRTGIIVGDVSGHGVGPAILTSATNYCLRTLATTSSDPAAMLSTANRLLPMGRGDGHFVTVMLAALNPAQAALEFAGAGDEAFVLGLDGGVRHRLGSTGAPLGLQRENGIGSSLRVELQSGDIVLLLTDGFHETMSPDKRLFGQERVFEVVHRHRHLPAGEILKALHKAATEFGGAEAQRDDMTGVIVKFGGG